MANNSGRPAPPPQGGQAAQAGQGAANKAGDLVQQGKDALAGVAEKGKQAATQLMDQAGEAGKKVQRWAGDAYEMTADKAKEYTDQATDLVRKYPIPAVLIALGAGLIIGKLLK